MGILSIFALGDFYQLPHVFKQPRNIQNVTDMAPLIWDIFQFYELTEIMRKMYTACAELLNEVCIKNQTNILMLKNIELQFREDHPLHQKHVYLVFVQNEDAKHQNSKMLNNLNVELYICQKVDSVRDRQTHLDQAFVLEKTQNTGNLLPHDISVGARVMLTMVI